MSIATLARRLFQPLVVVAMIGGAVVTYQAKHQAVLAAEEVVDLRHEIEQERIALSLLKAEWATLTQPDRLAGITERWAADISLGPYGTDRMIRVRDLPPLPPPGEATVATAAGTRR